MPSLRGPVPGLPGARESSGNSGGLTKHDIEQFSLPPVRRDELHDDIALALDSITGPRPSARNLAEAASYLRHALRLIGGEAE